MTRRAFAVVVAGALVTSAVAVQLDHVVRLRAFRGIAPICRVRTDARIVALSFDDGPDPAYTPRWCACSPPRVITPRSS